MLFGFEHLAKDMWVRLFTGQATPYEKRCCSGTFALMPFGLLAFVYLGPRFLARTDLAALFMAGFILVGSICFWGWVKLVPAKLSWVLGTVFWLAELWWGLTGRR